MLTVDGKNYNVLIKAGTLKREFEIAEGPGSLTFISGDEDPDVIGTYIHYSVEIDTRMTNPEEYDALFEVLSAPVKYHTVTFPYGQSTLTFEARITGGGDTFRHRLGGKNYWGEFGLTFQAKRPQRTP